MLGGFFLFFTCFAARATSVPPEGLIAWLSGQPIGYTNLEPAWFLMSGDQLLEFSDIKELRVEAAATAEGESFLLAGNDKLAYTIVKNGVEDAYFVLDSVAFDRWVALHFPGLAVPVVEKGGLKVYSYPEVKKSKEKGFKLNLVLKQIGIPANTEAAASFAKLDNFRDALGSSILQWVSANKDQSVTFLEGDRFRSVPRENVSVLNEGEGMLAGSYQVNKFTGPAAAAEPRNAYLWLFLGMVAGGAVMALVVLGIGRAKKSGGSEISEEDAGKLMGGKKTGDQSANEDIRNQIKGAVENPDDPSGVNGLRDGPGNDPDKPGFADLLAALDPTGGDEEGDHDLKTMQQVLHAVAMEMKEQGQTEGHDYMVEFREQLSDWIPAIEGLRLMAESADADLALARVDALRAEMEKDASLTVLPKSDSPSVQNLETVLRSYQSLQKKVETSDPARPFLAALEKRYGILTEDLERMGKKPTDEQRAEWVAKLIKLALHLNDFMLVYLERQHTETTKLNLRMVKHGWKVADLDSDSYRHFSESKEKVLLPVQNLRSIARDLGIRSLDDVLVKGYYIPPSALQN